MLLFLLSQYLDLMEPVMVSPRRAFSVQYFPTWSLDGPLALKLAAGSALFPADCVCVLPAASHGGGQVAFWWRSILCTQREGGLGFFMAAILLNYYFPRVIYGK